MKKLFSITLIFVLSFPCLFRLGVVAYYEVNKDYIANALCINKENPAVTLCYGRCFLDKKFALADETRQQKAPVKVNVKTELAHFIIIEHAWLFTPDIKNASLTSRSLNHYAFKYISSIFRPPLFS